MSLYPAELRRYLMRDLLPRVLPFSDAATAELPLPRLLRLSLFQGSVGMTMVLLYGTLNRVMVVEMGVPTWLVSLMVALPVLFAPLRALIGFKSDNHRSAFGLRRIPYIWFGSLMQFGGLAFMPFALLLLSEGGNAPPIVGQLGAGMAFLLAGAGLHTTQTAGLALATDIAPKMSRPRVVALLFVALQISMLGSALLFGLLLTDFTQMRLIQVIQGAAVATMVLNVVALWKQELWDRKRAAQMRRERDAGRPRPKFRESWRAFIEAGRSKRLLVALGLGTAGFTMQEILLEPYGAQVLGLTVAETTRLTAIWAFGTLVAFGLAARTLTRGADTYRLSAYGALIGICAFTAVIFSDPLDSPWLFRAGAMLIGFGGGLFAVGTLTAAMNMADDGAHSGLALGAWGAVQATAYGVAIAFGGAMRDVITHFAAEGVFGPVLTGPAVGYDAVYHLEIVLLFATLIAIGPLVSNGGGNGARSSSRFGLAELP
ncbi:MAG: BCD family MFS transporter [Thiohalocapsa sp.]|uniref:BCD family MFS transporter n=1 Tax=Thiohalocapsa sp. TaxID=2497641 RepID=UPI0025F469A5|nr:BCD family MFS transporter [Thiohalocapsa sp.]MCG6943097.1 BCD family MFS transporter [Thiohalocapsa sp.]